jgi:hypothetical protein
VVSFTPLPLYHPTHWIRGIGCPEPVWTLWRREKSLVFVMNRNSAIKSVASRYTDRAVPAAFKVITSKIWRDSVKTYILGSDCEDMKLTDLLRIMSNGVLLVLSDQTAHKELTLFCLQYLTIISAVSIGLHGVTSRQMISTLRSHR